MDRKFVCGKETPLVETASGKVRGYIYNGVEMYKGIPYAKAKRFHAPEPVDSWEDIFDATSYGFVCPLMEQGRPTGELGVPHRYWLMDENCQNLNVWTPKSNPDAKLPVLVWLHGGGFTAGSAIEQIAYEGENLSRDGNCVVVSVNHRLNILGYLDLSDFGPEYENSGNAGGDDIIAALKWVNKNIKAFGGDAENVTVFGQSGGGAKVTTLLQSPGADGLFHKGIVMSGVVGPILADSKGSGKECVQAIMDELGLDDVKQLETVPYSRFAEAYNKVAMPLRMAGKNVGCSPYPNAHYLGDPTAVGFREETKNIPLMVGSVFAEFAAFIAPKFDKWALSEEERMAFVEESLGKDNAEKLVPLFRQVYPERNITDLVSLDTIFRLPSMVYIGKRAGDGGSVYSYLFELDFDFNGESLAWHCADIPFFFKNTELVPVANIEGVTEKLEEQMFGSLIAFAKTGNPNNSAVPSWPASTALDEAVMMFGKKTLVRHNHDRELIPALAPVAGEMMMKIFQRGEADIKH